MRPPWMQVDMGFVEAKAGDLGALLGISRREAVGLAVDLWSWVLKRSPDDAPPDGIVRDSRTGTGAVPLLESAAGWTGPEGRLADALVETGLLERLPDGVRFRGTERYLSMWRKNRRKPASKPKPTRSGSAPVPAAKIETEIEIKKEDPPNPPSGAVGIADGRVWSVPDAVDAVHRQVTGQPHTWRAKYEDQATRELKALCEAEGFPPAEHASEIARRFGRALLRVRLRFEHGSGKASTLSALSRPDCWTCNGRPVVMEVAVRNRLEGGVTKQDEIVDPWDDVLSSLEASRGH